MEDTLLYTIEQLKAKTLEELKEIYVQVYRTDPHWNIGAEKLIEKIMVKAGDPAAMADAMSVGGSVFSGTGSTDEAESNSESTKSVEQNKDSVSENLENSFQSKEDSIKTGPGLVEEKDKSDKSIKPFTPNPAFKADKNSKEGIVLVELTNPRRTGSLTVRDYTDVKTGKLREFLDMNGNKRVMMITKNFKLDLSDANDRLYYDHLKDHPLYTLSTTPAIVIKDQFQDSIIEVDQQEEAISAKSIIMQLNETQVRDFARMLGVKAPAKTSAIVIKNEIYKMCDKNPSHVIKMWNHPQKDTHILVRKAIDLGVLEKEGHFFKLNDIKLGTSADEIILYIMNTPELLPTIRKGVEDKLN
jgi:hypothetical protein